MPFAEDMDLFLDTSDFATSITVDGATVSAIFEEAWVEIALSSLVYSGTKPTLFGKLSDFIGKQGKVVVVGSDNYTIIDIQPDGSGMALVVLTEAAV